MNAPSTRHLPVGVFFALFAVSGFAGLIYESIWSHYLKLFLGHAAYAQTLVLAIFMGGMALGAWLVSKWTHRLRNLLLGYAAAEFGIGVLALVFHNVFVAATAWSYESVMPALGGTGFVDAFKWSLAAILILPASILLGSTFPLMSGGIVRLYPGTSGPAFSMLYFTNSFGAAVGVLASGFFLVDHVGLPGTILLAGVLNVLLAIVVWALARHRGTQSLPAAPGVFEDRAAVGFGRAILVAALFTGAASFIHEITWIRMLSLGLGASTHSFEAMLAAFIFGMSAGALWLRRRLDGIEDTTGWLVGVLVAKAVLAVLAIYIYTGVLDFVRWMMSATARSDAGYTLTTLAGLAASMAVMVPTAFCAGMTLPLATLALTRRGFGESAIGRVYAANTAGCILGAAFTTHVGMEWLGVKGLTGAGALVDASVAVLLLVSAGQLALRRTAIAMAVVGVGAIVAFAMSDLDKLKMASGVFRYGEFIKPADGKLLFYKDGKTATISVVEIDRMVTIRTNGKPDAGVQFDAARPVTEDEPTMALLAALPLAMKPQAKTVANIGFGSGLTSHGLLASPRLERADSIEIERTMVEAARKFLPRNARAYEDPRSRIHYEDAKTFFAASGARYDVIVSEPSNPWVSGVSTLFSEEFYGQVKRHLQPDGLLVQWIHAYELDLPLLASIFNALGTHFADYAVYSWSPGDLYVVASPRAALPKLSGEMFGYPKVAADLAALGIRGVADLEALRVGTRRALEPLFFTTGMGANSDYFPVLDQRAPRTRYRGDNVFELAEMRDAWEPLLPLLDGESRLPVQGLASRGRTTPPKVERAIAAAEGLAVFAGSPVDASRLTSPQRANALTARGLLANCEGAQLAWLRAFEGMLASAAPYLDDAAIAPAIERARNSACGRSLLGAARHRLDFMDAVARRDAPVIAREAAKLLELDTGASDRERASYLVSAIGALVREGRADEARALAGKYVSALSSQEARRLQVRLAFAHLAVQVRR